MFHSNVCLFHSGIKLRTTNFESNLACILFLNYNSKSKMYASFCLKEVQTGLFLFTNFPYNYYVNHFQGTYSFVFIIMCWKCVTKMGSISHATLSTHIDFDMGERNGHNSAGVTSLWNIKVVLLSWFQELYDGVWIYLAELQQELLNIVWSGFKYWYFTERRKIS